MMDISDERLGELWRMPDHYMRPISFGRAVALAARSLALEEAAQLYGTGDVAAPVGQSTYGEIRQEGWIDGTKAYRDAIRLMGEDAGRGADVVPKTDRFLGMVRVWVERDGGDMDKALAWMYADEPQGKRQVDGVRAEVIEEAIALIAACKPEDENCVWEAAYRAVADTHIEALRSLLNKEAGT